MVNNKATASITPKVITTAEGAAIAGDDSTVYAYRSTAMTPTTLVTVGWTGNDRLGDYACLASHPDRCWGVPGTITAPPSTLNAHAADDFFALMYMTGTSSSATVTILRSIGTGDRPQPLP